MEYDPNKDVWYGIECSTAMPDNQKVIALTDMIYSSKNT